MLESSDTGSTGVQAFVGTNYAGQVDASGVDDTASFSESTEWQGNATPVFYDTLGRLHQMGARMRF